MKNGNTTEKLGITQSLVRAKELFKRDELRAAINVLFAAYKDNPASAEITFALSNYCRAAGFNKRATIYFTQTLELAPTRIEVMHDFAKKLSQLGQYYRDAGQLELGADYLALALKLRPENEKDITMLGGIFSRLGQFDAALKILERGRTLNPRDRVVLYEIERIQERRTRVNLPSAQQG